MWRLNKLVASASRFRRVTISILDVIIPFAVLLGLNVLFMLIWTLVDPMYYDRSQRCGADESTSFGSCRMGRTDVSVAMAVSVAVVDLLALLLANLQAYKARNIKTDFNESGHVGIAMLSILQIFLVGTPLVFLVTDNPPAQFFVLAAMVSVVCLSVLLLIFVPKIMKARKEPEGERSSVLLSNHFRRSGHNATFSGGSNLAGSSRMMNEADPGATSPVPAFERSDEQEVPEQRESTKEC